MSKKRSDPRLYRRGGRYYADLRTFADVGGRQEALHAPGEAKGTTDHSVAVTLLADRLKELEVARRDRAQELDAARKDRALHGLRRRATLADYASHHLARKAEAGKVETSWIASHELMLRRAIAFLGAERPLHAISVSDVQRWTVHLAETKLHGGRPGGGTVRHHLNVLSNLYRRAQSEGAVPPGYNPVAAMLEKPTGRRLEAQWLEVPDAALLLEAARRPLPQVNGHPTQLAYPLLATHLLTGGRSDEVLGLEVGDVSFDRKTVTFRPNAYRRLKTQGSHRAVPLWPQLEEILRPYTDQRVVERGGTLLFPAEDGKKLRDWRGVLDRVAVRAGWRAGEIRSKRFRHTYCAARLQTLDQGAPVSLYTVSRELGHSSTAMVERVYSHLGTTRHRAEVMEYRVEQHVAILGERLTALSAANL